MSYLKSIGTAIIYIGLFLAVITFLPGLPPDAEFHEFSAVKPRALDPKVGPKDRLRNVEIKYVDEIIGAESFDSYNGKLYSGTRDGYVVRLEEDRVVPIVKFGQPCDGLWQEDKCGRPLGLKFDKNGDLYVVDTYYGIFKVNVTTGKYKNIVNITKPIEGKAPKLPNSVDIATNGDIYWTDSSTDFYLYDGIYVILADPSGRLIRYNAAKKKNEVLLQNIWFANGIKLSDDESFVIVMSSAMSIIKYHLKGPKAGQHEIFVKDLPGVPDNVHSDGRGGFLVSLITSVDLEHPELALSLMPHPYIRKMIVRLLTLLEAPFKLLQEIYPNTCAEKFINFIGSFSMVKNNMQKSTVLRIDASGNILESLISDDDTVIHVSSAYIHNGYLWLGSPWLNYVMRISLKQAFPDFIEQSTKQPLKMEDAKSEAKLERTKRNTVNSATVKAAESKTTTKRTPPEPSIPSSAVTAKPTAAPKPTTTPKSTIAPKPTVAPKASPTPKSNFKSSTGGSVKPQTKSTPKPANTRVEKDDAKTSTNFEKNVKVEQDTPAKRKVPKTESEKKFTETSRPKDAGEK